MSRVAYSVAASLENGLSAVGSPEVSGLLRTLGHNEPKLFVTLGRLSQDVINLGRERMNLRLIDGRVFDDLVREGYDDFSPEYRTKLFSHSVQIQEYAAVAAWPVAKEPDMPPPVQELHLVAEIQTTRLWHSVRRPDGRWTRLWDVGLVAGNAPSLFYAGACAGIGAELHLLVDNAPPLHTIRHVDGTWDNFGQVRQATGYRDPIWGPACASIGDELHVVATSSEDRIIHVIRHADRSWGGFRDVSGQAGRQGPVTGSLALCALAGELHVFVVAADQGILHTVRHANGHWDAWENLSQIIRNPPRTIADIAAAAVGTDLQVVTCDTPASLSVSHALRRPGGAWTPFGDLYREAGNPGYPMKAAAAAVNGEFHLALVTNSKPYLFHCVRHPNGTWTKFADVARATGRPGTDPISGVSIAGVAQGAGQVPVVPVGPSCYPGTPGASRVDVQNATGDDTLSVWRFDASAAIPALIATIDPGVSTSVVLSDCHFNQVIAVSHNWLDTYNATFGTDYDPAEWPTAQTVNFQRWVANVLGRTGDPIIAAAVF